MLGLSILIGGAVAASALWLGGAAVYISTRIGWDNLFGLYPGELATLAAAAFAPVAALWLMVAFLGNGLSLAQQTRTMRQFMWQARRSADHTEIMARMLIEMQRQGERGTFFSNVDLLLGDLNAAIAEVAERSDLLDPAEAEILWRRAGQGDRWIFARLFLDALEADQALPARLGAQAAGDQALRNAVFSFFRRYDHLLGLIEKHDPDAMIIQTIEESPVGKLQALFRRSSHFRAEAAMNRMLRGEEDDEPSGTIHDERQISMFDEPEAIVEDPAELRAEHAPPPTPEPPPEPETKAAPAPAAAPEPQAEPQAEPDPEPVAKPADSAPKKPAAPRPKPGRPELVAVRDEGVGRPFSPLTPDFPKADSWPADFGEDEDASKGSKSP